MKKNGNVFAKGYENQLTEWIRFYEEVFDLTVDFSDVAMPEKRKGFNWLIIMLQGMTCSDLLEKSRSHFLVWCYFYDFYYSRMDRRIRINSVRTSEKTYAVLVRGRIKADKENKYKSANDCDKEGLNGITLEERLLLELFYYWRTGKHLDSNHITTLCTGSRDSNGDVVNVDWTGYERVIVNWGAKWIGEMSVNCSDPDHSDGDLRAREVVST